MIDKRIFKAANNLIMSGIFMIVFITCGKIEREPKVETGTISEVTTSSARAEGRIIDIGKGINNHGHCWSINSNPDISDSKTMLGPKTNTGSFASNLTGLFSGTTYHIRAYAWDTTRIVYGEDISFNTGTAPVNDLVAYYPFNGNVNDLSGNNNHGTVYGATLTTDRHGVANSAYLFDGENDYIEVNHSSSLNISQQISISLWLKFETSAPYYFPYHIIEKYGSWSIGQRVFDIGCGISDYNLFILNLEPDRYYHFVMTFNGSSLTAYLDGVLRESTIGSGLIPTTNNNIFVGKYSLGEGYYFDGTIDDIRIFNRALTQQEITILYNE